MNKLWCIHTMEYCWAENKMDQMNLKTSTPTERSHTVKLYTAQFCLYAVLKGANICNHRQQVSGCLGTR
jgi:hypothetical protein